MLLEYEDLVWIELGIILKDIIDNMCIVDINVVVDRFGFLLILFFIIVLDYIKNVCNVFEDKIKDICIENSLIEIIVIKMMS